MKIVFCWAGLSEYMASCWRQLATLPGVDLTIFARARSQLNNTSFDDNLFQDLNIQLLDNHQIQSAKYIRERLSDIAPDIVFVSGWMYKGYYEHACRNPLPNCRYVMVLDNPRQYNLRQFFGKIWFRPSVKHFFRVLVAGERSWQFARYLGFAEHQIVRGAYGIDYVRLSEVLQHRLRHPWPRCFLFAGQFVLRKGLRELLRAYQLYAEASPDPFALRMCGNGPLVNEVFKVPHVEYLGFRQPDEMSEIWATSGLCVLPSLLDHWPLVLVEACAAGLPIICTNACGSSVELVRSLYNGLVVSTGDVEALTQAFAWFEDHYDMLPQMGARGNQLAGPYAAHLWAKRIMNLAEA